MAVRRRPRAVVLAARLPWPAPPTAWPRTGLGARRRPGVDSCSRAARRFHERVSLPGLCSFRPACFIFHPRCRFPGLPIDKGMKPPDGPEHSSEEACDAIPVDLQDCRDRGAADPGAHGEDGEARRGGDEGRLAAGNRRLPADCARRARPLVRRQRDGDRWSLRGNEGGRCRVRAARGRIEGRGHPVDEGFPEDRGRRRVRIASGLHALRRDGRLLGRPAGAHRPVRETVAVRGEPPATFADHPGSPGGDKSPWARTPIVRRGATVNESRIGTDCSPWYGSCMAARYPCRRGVSDVKIVLLSLVILARMAAPAAAHHSFAAGFDSHRPVTLKGVVTKIEWTNPHTHVFLDIVDDKHVTTNWKFELASPQVLLQQGWRARSLNVGDEVTIDGWMARDSPTTVNARIVTLANGRQMSAGSSGGDVPLK